MRRGTTTQLVLGLSEALDFDAYYVTFKQGGAVILEKTEADCVQDGAVITVPLSQEDTLAMQAKNTQPIYVQVRGLVGEAAYATSIERFLIGDILKDGVIPEPDPEEEGGGGGD